MKCSEAGVRIASREETAGEFAPAVVSVYGDLTRAFDLICRFFGGGGRDTNGGGAVSDLRFEGWRWRW
jgi:hypothetical protein